MESSKQKEKKNRDRQEKKPISGGKQELHIEKEESGEKERKKERKKKRKRTPAKLSQLVESSDKSTGPATQLSLGDHAIHTYIYVRTDSSLYEHTLALCQVKSSGLKECL